MLDAQLAIMVPQLQGCLRGFFYPPPQTPAESGRGGLTCLKSWAFLRSGRETWPSWPSSRFPQPGLPLWWLCRSPEGVCSHPACSLESELVGLPEGLVMSGVPLATLTRPAWSSPLLGSRDIPHTNSALSPEGWEAEHLHSPPIPASTQHEQPTGYSNPCTVSGPRDEVTVSGAGWE